MNISCFFAPFPVLDVGDIILREIDPAQDAAHYHGYMTNPLMRSFLTDDNIPNDPVKAQTDLDYWRRAFYNRYSIYWAIALKSNNQMIGTAGFNHIHFANSRADISYDLNPDYWGKGIMLYTVKAIVNFSDIVLELARIQATIITDNHRSLKLAERCGFEREGLMKKYEVVENEHKDYYMYARIRPGL
jgi:ribosomal-protein-alanine N-acetyltransferase